MGTQTEAEKRAGPLPRQYRVERLGRNGTQWQFVESFILLSDAVAHVDANDGPENKLRVVEIATAKVRYPPALAAAGTTA